MRVAGAALAASLALAAHAQEISIVAGGARADSPRETAPAWSIAYTEQVKGALFAGATYLNEGHVPGHHRDGLALQLGLRARPLPPLTLAIAAGPYRYADTDVAEHGAAYGNAHGGGVLYTATARWDASARWYGELRAERVRIRDSFDTTGLFAGVGWRLERDRAREDAQPFTAATPVNEATLAAGRSIVNSFESENAAAWGIEYRRAFGSVLHGTLAWIDEGDPGPIRRNGAALQAWLEPSFSAHRFTLGLGYGAYFAREQADGQRHTMGLLSTTASLALSPRARLRITWHRTVSGNDRDSDVILLGLGYAF